MNNIITFAIKMFETLYVPDNSVSTVSFSSIYFRAVAGLFRPLEPTFKNVKSFNFRNGERRSTVSKREGWNFIPLST
jgi:hypothetical protein